MIKHENRKLRAQKEDDAWKQIDIMTDQNKQALNVDIEKSIVAKAELTLASKALRDKNVQKDSQIRLLEEKKINFEENKVQT